MASHIGTGWEDQWDRVRRWHRRVRVIGDRAPAGGVFPNPMGGQGVYEAWALDLIYAFFMNCYHLRDWLIRSGAATKDDVDDHIDHSDALRWCRDICNGMKHFKLDADKRTTTYQSWTTASESKVVVSGSPDRPEPVAGFYWSFVDPPTGTTRDMFQLADACMKDWATFLKKTSVAS